MVVCPTCGNKLQYRKVLFLTNRNAITCQVCSSRVRVKNKDVSSVIGAVGGGLGGGLGAFFASSWVLTGNMLYLGLIAILLTADCVVSLLVEYKYVKVELKAPPKTGM